MSNSVSLFVTTESRLLSELKSAADDADSILLNNYLRDVDSDSYTFELSELVENAPSSSELEAADPILRLILWSWLDGKSIIDIDEMLAEELGLDLAISPASIERLSDSIDTFDPDSLADALFIQNDAWSNAEELSDYLRHWSKAFKDAKTQKESLFYKIWI